MFSFWKIFRSKAGVDKERLSTKEIKCEELAALAKEVAIRELAFDACVNMVARYVASCEFKTYRQRKPVTEREYYLWNIEPNTNQNKTAFLHKLIRTLYLNNEALIIEVGSGENAGLAVADSFMPSDQMPVRGNTYTDVVVGDFQYQKTFRERDVLHIKLNENPVKPVIDSLYQGYYALIDGAMSSFEYNSGRHWKVHVDQIASGDDEFEDKFSKMVNNQIKPFLTSKMAVLPEFDGYKYEDVSESRSTRSTTGESADVRQLIEDIFDFTALAFGIPSVLVKGKVENTSDAKIRFYTLCDTIINQLAQEINRKRYGFEAWKQGNYIRIDSANTEHFSLLENSANLEKLIGSAVYSVNDILAALGQPTIDAPWANAHYLTKNIGEINGDNALLTP